MRLVTSGSKKYRQQNQTYHSFVAISYDSGSSEGIYWIMDVVAIDEWKNVSCTCISTPLHNFSVWK